MVGLFLYALRCYVWNESHETRSLYCISQLSLVLCCNTCSLSCHQSSVRVQELLQDFSILVVNMLDIVLREVALL